ncbi:aminodeoxychorismate synthase component I [Methylophaga sp. OBS3]|uniref:aminodeoxychorismate synthase component I n=1 Tax=Methylophaga sp. OBS3 TaxID=2991934 RepID=UPI0022591FA1|nr:aminodeoxychorismate synthase component I [Methylophaga sp. OBS3]MCX4189927.1 aminodeoxychorismate synthase component I [Methylophaga sp. OBS3]
MTESSLRHINLPYHADGAIYFEQIRDLPWPVMLDSAGMADDIGRFDIITADPFITLETSGDKTHIQFRDKTSESHHEDPFHLLQTQLARFPTASADFPFTGGAIGYFAYDLGRVIESLPIKAEDVEHLPEMAVGIYDWALLIDHQTKSCILVCHNFDPYSETLLSLLVKRFENLTPLNSQFKVSGQLNTNMDESTYAKAFQRIQDYILEGDCYQVNLAKRFEIAADGDPWAAYKLLRKHNAAPFSAFLDTPKACVLSSSPERLLSVRNGKIETKPIKGTRPRALNNPAKDKQNADELLTSLKDRAENLMIVDLLRNDLGKVCVPGSIKVPKAFALESFATVHHLVSTITGTLAADQSPVSLLRACFPGGSITGAPKLRAMEIIEELEPHRRGVYCGSIAYIGFDGNMDSNITIRTLVYNHNRLRFWAGGGIVADSDCADEHQEVLDKAAAMLHLVEQLRQQ